MFEDKKDITEYTKQVSLEIKTIGKEFCSEACTYCVKTESIVNKRKCTLFQTTLFIESKFIKRTDKCIKLEV